MGQALFHLSYTAVGEAGIEPASFSLSESCSNRLSCSPSFIPRCPLFHGATRGKLNPMLFFLAFVAFLVAAIIAILGVHGVTLTEIVGIIAIGLALASAGWAVGPSAWWPGGWRRP